MNKKSLSMEKHEEAEEIDLQNTTLDQYMKSFKTEKVEAPKENKDKRRSPLTLDVQLNKNSGIMLNEQSFANSDFEIKNASGEIIGD